ncbi:MAG: anti-sigma factor antagonist [Frankiaceae bacterium]|jgi:anti-anti-sigma factor|nr:anti-sigma factor antagonist [Frankiaceae bacterium]MDQ1648763.1 anti-sigma factor antagonist [Frankiaceae bacterium]
MVSSRDAEQVVGGGSDAAAGAPAPDIVEIVVAGELDVAGSELSSGLTSALESGASRIVVNLLEVTFIDSSVLRTLLLAHREVTARHGWIRLVYTNRLIGRVISLTGLEQVLPQYASVAGARAGRALREGPPRPRDEESGGS